MTATTDAFSKFLGLSLAAHALALALLTFKAMLTPLDPLEIRSAIRVDVIALPEKNQDPPPVAPAQPTPVPAKEQKPPTPQAPEKIGPLKKARDLQKDALLKITQQDAVERLRSATVAPAKPIEYKGNKKNAGTELNGTELLQFDDYSTLLKRHVHAHWSLPQWLSDSGFKAQAVVQIDENGSLIKKAITKSSGNEIFDAQVLQALEAAVPFPAPPERLRSYLAYKGAVFNFPFQ